MTDQEIQKLIANVPELTEEVQKAADANGSVTNTKLKAEQDKLQPYLDRMSPEQLKRVENAMQALRVFRPAYYSKEAYEYQCVLPMTATLLAIGQELK